MWEAPEAVWRAAGRAEGYRAVAAVKVVDQALRGAKPAPTSPKVSLAERQITAWLLARRGLVAAAAASAAAAEACEAAGEAAKIAAGEVASEALRDCWRDAVQLTLSLLAELNRYKV